MRKTIYILFCVALTSSTKLMAQSPTYEIQGQTETGTENKTTAKHSSSPEPRSHGHHKKKEKFIFDSTRHLLEVGGAIYSSMPYFRDDNPAGYTQTYLRFNFMRPCVMDRKRHPNMDYSGSPGRYVAFSRNFFAEVNYVTNASNLPVYYSPDTANHIKYVNKLDLVKNANLKINLLENILTISNHHTHDNDWTNHLYLDAMASFMRTFVIDSPAETTPINVSSWLLGANCKASFRNNKNFTGKPIYLEVGGQLFWVNPFTNALSSDLNFQYQNRADYKTALNPDSVRPMVINPYAYYSMEFTARLGLKNSDEGAKTDSGKAKDKRGSNVFFHLAYTSNFASSTSNKFYNSYFVAQVGLEINITDAFSSLVDRLNAAKDPAATDDGTTGATSTSNQDDDNN